MAATPPLYAARERPPLRSPQLSFKPSWTVVTSLLWRTSATRSVSRSISGSRGQRVRRTSSGTRQRAKRLVFRLLRPISSQAWVERTPQNQSTLCSSPTTLHTAQWQAELELCIDRVRRARTGRLPPALREASSGAFSFLLSPSFASKAGCFGAESKLTKRFCPAPKRT